VVQLTPKGLLYKALSVEKYAFCRFAYGFY